MGGGGGGAVSLASPPPLCPFGTVFPGGSVDVFASFGFPRDIDGAGALVGALSSSGIGKRSDTCISLEPCSLLVFDDAAYQRSGIQFYSFFFCFFWIFNPLVFSFCFPSPYIPLLTPVPNPLSSSL